VLERALIAKEEQGKSNRKVLGAGHETNEDHDAWVESLREALEEGDEEAEAEAEAEEQDGTEEGVAAGTRNTTAATKEDIQANGNDISDFNPFDDTYGLERRPAYPAGARR
jgi:hypothetical protein